MSVKDKTFSFEDKNSVDFLYNDDDIIIASIDLFHIDNEDESNRNNCNISLESTKLSIPTFYNKPIICKYNSICKDFVSDVTDHAYDDEEEQFNMRIAGHIPSDSRIRFIKRDNGKIYCNCETIIQKRYMPQLVEILKKNDGKLKVSIEIKAKGHKTDDGVFVIEEFILQGVCLLGNDVEEGIEGSSLKVLKFSQNEINSLNEKYLKFSQQKESNQNIFDEIKKKNKEEEFVLASLSTRQLSEKLWNNLSKYEYSDGNWNGKKYYIEEIYPDEKEIIVRDNETAKYYKMPYHIDNGDVKVETTEKKEVESGWHERPLNEHRFSLVFAKEEYGKGETIKVDKSKEAVSDKKWGDVDKTELRHKVLNAKNYKTLVYDVYADVEDGWEDAPSEKLKYPIMLIEDDTAVYARYGLASALAYAKAENNTKVVDKVEKLYKTIDIKNKEENMDEDKDLKNKLDEHNSELKKIRDDADAMEDDEKEKLRKKVDNAVIDAPENDKLKDDIDADKDYWKKKYSEIAEKYDSIVEELKNNKEELAKYRVKEDRELMHKYLKSFKRCFNADEFDIMAKKIENSQRCDFEKEVDEKVKEFARKMSECDDDEFDDDVEIKNSQGNLDIIYSNIKSNGLQFKNIDDVLNSFKN